MSNLSKSEEKTFKNISVYAKVLESLPATKKELLDIVPATEYEIAKALSVIQRRKIASYRTADRKWQLTDADGINASGNRFSWAMEQAFEGKRVTCDSLQLIEYDGLNYYLEVCQKSGEVTISAPHITTFLRINKAMLRDEWRLVDEHERTSGADSTS